MSIARATRHGAEKLEHDIRREEGRDLTRTIERRRDLDDVAADEGETGETAYEPLRLVARQPAHFRRAGAGREGGVDRVDVKRHVRAARGHPADLVDRPGHTPLLHLLDVEHRDAVLAVEVEIVFAVHRPADTDLNEAFRIDDPLLDGAAKGRAVKIPAAEVLTQRV